MGSRAILNGELLFPSKYIADTDLKGRDFVVTISAVNIEDLLLVGGIKNRKPIVSFREAQKKLVLNVTNTNIVAELYGNEVNQWVGKAITLYPTTCKFKGKIVGCVRIREEAPKRSTTPNQAAMAAQAPPPEAEFDRPEFGVPDEAMEAVL